MRPRYPIGVAFDYGSFRMPERLNDPTGPTVFDPHLWDSFLETAVQAFRAERITDPAKSWMGGCHVWRLAATPRLALCVDITKDPAWLFVMGDAREMKSGTLRPYRVKREADRALRRLRRLCPFVRFID